MIELGFEDVAVFLPKYLSPSEQKQLFEEVNAVKGRLDRLAYYDPDPTFQDDLLQGDGWRGLVAINFGTLTKKHVSGVIISNSCDIDIRNTHDYPTNVLFAPLVTISAFEGLLLGSGMGADSISSKMDQIRKQRITSIFHLPERKQFIEESMILLDDIHRHPLSEFAECERTKLFTLSQTAFYLFLVKLSIHFHRVNEDVHRFIAPTAIAH